MELFPFFHQIFKILILFVLYFKNYNRQMVSWNCKHAQHVKIYLPCNFKVNLRTHFGVIRLNMFNWFALWHLQNVFTSIPDPDRILTSTFDPVHNLPSPFLPVWYYINPRSWKYQRYSVFEVAQMSIRIFNIYYIELYLWPKL